jgi:hypothetical protein
MKMVKSLLLGTAAGLVAMTGAQAADLPVKARPVQYVKICSLYGAGFYYVPGTDLCLKVGGWVRQYLGVNSNGNLTNGNLGSGNLNTRASNNGWTWKSRGYITADARSQTEWGTLRGYIAVGESTQGQAGGSTFNANRAFIQFAGFTFGVAQSFYDLYPTPALSYFGGMINPSSDTGDGGQTVTAYTAQFGNGFSASISAEAPRTTTVVGPQSAFSAGSGTAAGFSNQAISVRYPDVVANLRIDQAWGSAQIMGATHDASGLYLGTTTGTANALGGIAGPSGNAMGWALGAGIKLNAPMIGPGDYFSAQFNYAHGASGYPIDGAASTTQNTANAGGIYSAFSGGGAAGNVGQFGFGQVSDSVYGVVGGASTGIQLTTTWGVNAAYEHFWNKSWQTSLYGAYTATSYNTTANTVLCGLETAGLGATMTLGGGCNNNWNYYALGTRTQWNVDSQTYIGLDVVYTKLDTATNTAGLVTTAATGTQPAGTRNLSNESAFMAEMRVHRNFYP